MTTRTCHLCGRTLRGSRVPLAEAPGTMPREGKRCRSCATRARRGLPGAARNSQDVDPVTVQLVVSGTPADAAGPLTAAERRRVIEDLTIRGYSTAQTALLAGCSPRQVTRVRTALKQKDAA